MLDDYEWWRATHEHHLTQGSFLPRGIAVDWMHGHLKRGKVESLRSSQIEDSNSVSSAGRTFSTVVASICTGTFIIDMIHMDSLQAFSYPQ